MNTASTLGWSAYALPTALPTENSVIVVTPAGASSWQPYSGGGGGDAWLLGGNALTDNDYLGSTTNFFLGFKTNDTERARIAADGLFIFNHNLQLNNTTHASETGIIYKNDKPFIYDFNYGNNGTLTTLGYNTIVGVGAGNFTMGSTATQVHEASYNTIIGSYSFINNTKGYANVAIGYQSLYINNTGFENVAIGVGSLYANSTGNLNVAVGFNALKNNSGTYNTAVGHTSLYMNSSGQRNTAIGYQALYQNTTGGYNVAVGWSALNKCSTASYNNAVGVYALYYNSGSCNTAMGHQALYNNSSSSYNVAFGYRALFSNLTGSSNVAIGNEALSSGSGSNNTAIGSNSLYYNNASGNTAIGALALYLNSSGDSQVAIGLFSLYSNTTGTNNIAIGERALFSNVSGSNSTIIGTSSARYIANGSTPLTTINQGVFIGSFIKAKEDNSTNEIVIGYNAIGNGSNTVTIGNTSITDNYLNGNLQIGNKFKILEGGSTPSYYTIFQGGDQSADLTYTLPTAYPGASGYVLSSTDAGVLSWIEVGGGGGDAWLLGGNTLTAKNYLGSIDNYEVGFKTNDTERATIGTDGLFSFLYNVKLNNTTNASSTGIIYKGSLPFAHDFNYGDNGTVTTSGANTFIGIQAGNLSMGSTASAIYEASYNTFIGNQTGCNNTTGWANTFNGCQAGYTNDTGSCNVFVGYQSGYYNENSGWSNTFIGYQAGFTNYTGGSNTFIGYKAGYANATSGFNTAVGMEAGKNNSIGEENVFIGYQAGSHIADDATGLAIIDRSVYIGYDAKAKENSATNEIVIGYNTIGNGSNTVTIGNASITDNFLSGNLQIGNKFKILEGGTTPTYFSIFQGGDQTADLTYTLPVAYPTASGYVLSSTNAGVLSWIEAGGSGSCYWTENTDGIYYTSGNVSIGTTSNSVNSLSISKSDTGHGIDVYSTGGAAGYFSATANHAVIGITTNASSYGGVFTGGNGLLASKLSIGADTSNIAYTFPTADGTAGQVLSTDGDGVLTWIANGSGGCNWTGITGGIQYSDVSVYDTGYIVTDNAIKLGTYNPLDTPADGILEYNSTGYFMGMGNLRVFHNSYWRHLVEWDYNYLTNLVDVQVLGTPSVASVLKINTNKTVEYLAVSSLSKWSADYYGITYSNHVGIGTNSGSSYLLYVGGSGLTSVIQGYASDGSTAVDGLSQTGYGVKGQSNSGYNGVWGYCAGSAAGVYGNSNSGYGGEFAGLGVNLSAGGLYVGGNNVINSSRVADFASIKIGGTERISSAGVFTPSNGASGTWTTTDGKTITAVNGIITGIV
jgi:hypothetical protein